MILLYYIPLCSLLASETQSHRRICAVFPSLMFTLDKYIFFLDRYVNLMHANVRTRYITIKNQNEWLSPLAQKFNKAPKYKNIKVCKYKGNKHEATLIVHSPSHIHPTT